MRDESIKAGCAGTSRISLESLQPSQPVVSRDRLERVKSRGFEVADISLPVRTLGGVTFLTDGHTRALAAYMTGAREIDVFEDRDPLDWVSYAHCVSAVRASGVGSVADLVDRLVPEEVFEEEWVAWCTALRANLDRGGISAATPAEIADPAVKSKICRWILEALPEWFGIPEAREKYIAEVAGMRFFIAAAGSRLPEAVCGAVDVIPGLPVGFLAVRRHNDFTVEIHAMGVLREFHGRGVGRSLVEKARESAVEAGARYMTVKTLGPSRPDPGYDSTRRFYESVGFIPLEEFTELWGPENPCLFLVMELGSGRPERVSTPSPSP